MEIFTVGGDTVTISGTTASAATLIAGASLAERTIRIVAPPGNAAIAFITTGNSGAAALTTTGMPILPGTIEVFTIPGAHTHMAVITASSTATLYVTPGKGA
jgi:hypothetical protein